MADEQMKNNIITLGMIIGAAMVGRCFEVWCFMAPCPWICTPEPGHPPVGCHSHATHYNITYSQADLEFNKTRAEVQQWMIKSM